MSAHTKTAPIKSNAQKCQMLWSSEGEAYKIPINIAKKYVMRKVSKTITKVSSNLSAKDLVAHLDKKYTKAGALLKGARYRENLTQAQLAKKINVAQADLSKMENGKRPIGKNIAKRIEKVCGVNYRYFLE